MKQQRLYPDSGVELSPFIAKHYDFIMNSLSFGKYRRFIHKAIADIGIKPTDSILDLGCGTGRNASLMLKQLNDGGSITGIDLSPIMQKQFEKRFANEKRVSFSSQRIDIPFNLEKKFDIIFISFVLHGFPDPIRENIIENVKAHLKPNGVFAILDFSEFDINKMPSLHYKVFKAVECKYAFDYIERDWKKTLAGKGFENPQESFYFRNYVRLLKMSVK
jgi:demethylmenaquinone methyltransferase/2-methoxy-6-polyprenyl-1,4-benzoquinol methylase